VCFTVSDAGVGLPQIVGELDAPRVSAANQHEVGRLDVPLGSANDRQRLV